MTQIWLVVDEQLKYLEISWN